MASANPWSIMCVQSDSRTIEKRERERVDSGSRQCQESTSSGEVGSDEKSSNLWEEAGLGRQCDQKTWYYVRSPPSVVEQNVKRKPGLDLKNLPKTLSLEQVKASVRELEQEDVCDMEVDLAQVRWQESDTEVLNAFASRSGNSCRVSSGFGR